MSDIQKNSEIRVYNEMPTQINLEGQYRSYIFPPAVNGVPSMNYVEFADIEFANSRTNSFINGLLVFDENQQEEIYKKLRINDWQNKVWFEKDIVDIINNPTVEKMQRIIDITSLLVIERIRGKVVAMVNRKQNISNKVISIVDQRYRELASGIMKSAIVVKATDVQEPASSKEVEDLKQQIEEMKKLMAQMAVKPTETVKEDKTETVVETEPVKKTKTTTKRKATTPK